MNAKRHQVFGIVLIIFGVLTALGFISYDWRDIPFLHAAERVAPPSNYIGPFGAWFSYVSLMSFGYAAFLLPLLFLLGGVWMLFWSDRGAWQKFLWGGIVLLALSALLAIHPAWMERLAMRFNLQGLSGGFFGLLIAARFLVGVIGLTGANVLLGGLLAGALALFVGFETFAAIFRFVVALTNKGLKIISAWREARRDRIQQIEAQERDLVRQTAALERELKKKERMARAMAPEAEPEHEKPFFEPKGPPEPPSAPIAPSKPQTSRPKKEKLQSDRPSLPAQNDDVNKGVGDKKYNLPPLSLLSPLPEAEARRLKTDHQTTSHIIKETLAEFGIECDVTNIEQGPTVTRFELLPAPGVRVEKISGLSNNLALALKAHSVRVQAPIPGKGVVGVEVPNAAASRVCLRDLLESETWHQSRATLPLVLGQDVAGKNLIADLATMPHLLIAGATGSGKTVCMNSILAGLLMSRGPDQLRLMLVDPKIVEFSVYAELPHLVVPVITDSKKVTLGLRWAINEMEKRFKIFAKTGVRDIAAFNSRPPKPVVPPPPAPPIGDPALEDAEAPLPAPVDEIPERMPHVVIVIDELADLMMVAQADVENAIARLAQLSRAVGIHMILATQRPSVNVITGTIKANFPSRISFQVAQKTDSRTILDAVGAEKLLGRGDMLFLPPGTSKLLRAQGAMTTDAEINAIAEHWKQQGKPEYIAAVKESIESVAPPPIDDGVDDDLIQQSIAIIRESRRATTSFLQRRLRIGYTRAARIMEILEQRGIVGPPCGSDPREILIDLDGEIPSNSAQQQENI